MTNFDKWKAELTQSDLLKIIASCENCPAKDYCDSYGNAPHRCIVMFYRWANQEAT